MKKVLIVIHDMRIGGAQRSLLSFLQCLTDSAMGNEYDISLLVIDPEGPFMGQIPNGVKLLPLPKPLRWLGRRFGRELLTKHFSLNSLLGECTWLVRKGLKQFPQKLNLQQKLWYSWKNRIPDLKEHYDIAISYMDGVPNYFVTDKVSADKKVLWVHSEYQKQGYDSAFDRRYFEVGDGIVTISQNCKACIAREFPHLEGKIHILENITSPKKVMENSRKGKAPEFDGSKGVKLLTVARLNPQKGIDLAAEAASLLKKEGLEFLWLVAGDGPQCEAIQEKIQELELTDYFRLLGSRDNPYGYMNACDILVQPSRVEGKSIVLDEAKLLCKPIVATNYTTVADSLENGKTGLVVEMTPRGIAEGILKLAGDRTFANTLTENLKALPKGNEAELARYIQIML